MYVRERERVVWCVCVCVVSIYRVETIISHTPRCLRYLYPLPSSKLTDRLLLERLNGAFRKRYFHTCVLTHPQNNRPHQIDLSHAARHQSSGHHYSIEHWIITQGHHQHVTNNRAKLFLSLISSSFTHTSEEQVHVATHIIIIDNNSWTLPKQLYSPYSNSRITQIIIFNL